MVYPDEAAFERLWAEAEGGIDVPAVGAVEAAARLALWRRQEWHNWVRWRVCGQPVAGRRQSMDWSKPGVIGLLTVGFVLLVWYGWTTERWFVTAGGVVAWFTAVNLSFFTYFGLTLPGPPAALAGPLEAGRKYRAQFRLYPPGYERRKLARIRVQIGEHRFELAMVTLPEHLEGLLKTQTTSRMQRGEAPVTRGVVETLAVDRAGIDAGGEIFSVAGWRWDE